MAIPPFKVKAVYDYSSPHEDDLNFPAGQIINVTEKEDEDWYIGEYTDDSGDKHDGLFPKNFVEKYEPPVPSRPARAARPQSEFRAPAPAPAPVVASVPAPTPAPAPAPVPRQQASTDEVEQEREQEQEPEQIQSKPAPPPPVETNFPPPPRRNEEPTVKSPRSAAAPAPAEKKAPPPVSEKPSSFKDRIAAFNKATAPPVAPFKPTGGAPSFIKKPFVAPPPSSNAYVAPPRAEPVQKVYRREEDPEIQEKQEQDRADAERAGLLPHEHTAGTAAAGVEGGEGGEEEAEAPKPQSLKERIAMLQKQQMEQAARRADVGHKEKPKKPVKKNTQDSVASSTGDNAASAAPPPVPAALVEEHDNVDDEQQQQQSERTTRASVDQPREVGIHDVSDRRTSLAPLSRPPTGHDQPELFSDTTNDADLSAAGDTTEDNDVDSEYTPPATSTFEAARPSVAAEPQVGQEEKTVDEESEGEEEEEDDEMDAEARRRLELRERMAKMSGGMGMAGMFGAPGGMPMGQPPQKKKSTKDSNRESRPSADSQDVRSPTGAPQVPMIPIPGMQLPGLVRSPEDEDRQLTDAHDHQEDESAPSTSQRRPQSGYAGVDALPEPTPRASLDRGAPPVPQERPFSSPTVERAVAPPLPADRPVPHPPAQEARAQPPPLPNVITQQQQQQHSDTEGSVSDDESSAYPPRSSVDTTRTADSSYPSRTAPPPLPTTARPNNPRSPPLPGGAKRASYFQSDAASPTSPMTPASATDKRASRMPPIPGISTGPMPPNLARAPPPPPPTAEPFAQAPPVPRPAVEDISQGESEYEGDYDTDIAPTAKHKDALKSYTRDATLADSNIVDEAPQSPPPVPPPHAAPAPRAIPPLPPLVGPSRSSMDAPRVAPPLPPTRDVEPRFEEQEEYEHDTSSRALPLRAVPPPPPPSAPAPPPAQLETEDSSDDLYSASPPRRSIDRPPPPPPHAAPAHERSAPQTPSSQTQAPTFSPPQPSRQSTRQSVDVPRQSMSTRRSMDQSRPADNGHIATDVDLGERTQWWASPDLPPPVFQGRNDVLVEIEESSTTRRGGKTTVAKDVYVLFIDYSQTVITARFDSREPNDVSFEQRHEPPPARLRQDQLESFWQRYGARIADAAASKRDTVVGDGSPKALVLELLRPFKDALLPVGGRAFGALVYANLANASVQQFDEIRPGDIITLRNAKLQGKHGTMHQKYTQDVGLQGREHVAVVVDWDGTKKKVRVWEQGREKPKIRLESFRLGDLKSGEVRVFRIVGRQWVGWETEA